MKSPSISSFLKQLRKTSGLSTKEVVERLHDYSIDISVKTLYGYESGLSMLNADAFVALCKIYKCDNPMDIFDTPTLNPKEQSMVEKYRELDSYGQETVDIIIERELNNTEAREAQKTYLHT